MNELQPGQIVVAFSNERHHNTRLTLNRPYVVKGDEPDFSGWVRLVGIDDCYYAGHLIVASELTPLEKIIYDIE